MKRENGKKGSGVQSSGQSETLGLVLLFGVTFTAISVVLVTGMPVLDDARENAQVERIQNEFSTLDHELRKSVYTPSESSATIDISEGGVEVNSSAMSVMVEYSPSSGGYTDTAELTLGGLEYEQTDTSVAYQNGGVWATRKDGGYSMRTPPDISYSGSNLKMNFINITSDRGFAGSSADIGFKYEGEHRSTALENITNSSLETGDLNVSVESEHDDAWTEYFNRTFGVGNVNSTGDGFANVSLDTGPPLFGVEYLEDRFEDSGPPSPTTDQEATVYDSRIGDESEYNYTFNASNPLPSASPNPTELPVDGTDIQDKCVDSGSGPNLPTGTSTVTAENTSEYSETGSVQIANLDFDTSEGDISVYIDGSGNDVNLGPNVDFETDGGKVEFHLGSGIDTLRIPSGAGISVNGTQSVVLYGEDANINLPASAGGINLEDGRTELFQIYSGTSGNIDIQGDYNGTIYAPDSSITIQTPSTYRGAAIAGGSGGTASVDVQGEYYHDASLRQANLPDCINPPLRNLESVERRIGIR